jgi:hypothetical protein
MYPAGGLLAVPGVAALGGEGGAKSCGEPCLVARVLSPESIVSGGRQLGS